MKQDELDRILSEETEMVPSSGFVSGVMDAVRREASVPPSIPFPWVRALPGLAAFVLAVAAMITVLVKNAGRAAPAPPSEAGLLATLAPAVEAANTYGIGWILLALLVTLASVMVSMRLTTGTWRTL